MILDDKLNKEGISFIPHYSSNTIKSAKQRQQQQQKQFIAMRPASMTMSHQTNPTGAINYQQQQQLQQQQTNNSIYENAAAREPQLIIPMQNQNCTLVTSVHAPCEFGDSNPFLNMINSNSNPQQITVTAGSTNTMPSSCNAKQSSRMMQLPARPSHGFPKTVPGLGASSVSRSSTNSPAFMGDENCRFCLRAEEHPEMSPHSNAERESTVGSHYASVDPMFYCDNYTALEMCVNGSD